MSDKTIEELRADNTRLIARCAQLQRALSLSLNYGCDVSNFVYEVLHGDAVKALSEWEDNRNAVRKASSRRLTRMFKQHVREEADRKEGAKRK